MPARYIQASWHSFHISPGPGLCLPCKPLLSHAAVYVMAGPPADILDHEVHGGREPIQSEGVELKGAVSLTYPGTPGWGCEIDFDLIHPIDI